MSFSSKVVIVTGAASGIGAATAELFDKEGAAVTMVDKDGNKLQMLAEHRIREGRNILAITANVADDDDVKKVVKETIDKFGKLDVLVNCAGIIKYGTILDGKLMQSYDELMNINLRAVMQMTCQAAPHLIKTKGNIINIASAAASRIYGVEHMAYCVSKIGVTHFTRGAAIELAPYGIRVNSISPGPVRTNILGNSGRENVYDGWSDALTVLKRISEPHEIADMTLYIASNKAKGVTGSDFVVDNGSLLKLGCNSF